MTTPSPVDRTVSLDLHGGAHRGDQVPDIRQSLAAAALQTEAESHKDARGRDFERVDSAQGQVDQLAATSSHPRSGRHTPLTVQTAPAVPETLATSPILRQYIRRDEGAPETLPALQPSSPHGKGLSTSPPQFERLPSFGTLAKQLDSGPRSDLADVCVQHESRRNGQHQHSASISGRDDTSPILPVHIPPNTLSSVQTSPVAPNPYTFMSTVPGSARSPTSTISETLAYNSPAQSVGAAYYMDRRSSLTRDTPSLHAQSFPPSLPSASSGDSSHPATSSSISTDGYSTTITTPTDIQPGNSGPGDGFPPQQQQQQQQQRTMPILPPPPGMSASAIPPQSTAIAGSYKCEHPGCEAAPFQTQYLLTSHQNVHSSSRPHYCPVPGCPRGLGGKGFKRKNEMIRHGLVHDSPGYVCPFCPDREHRYPRPDNLQRHVRVHHMDKDREDPLLREVLAQRRHGHSGGSSSSSSTSTAGLMNHGNGGGGGASSSITSKPRRRRAGTVGSTSA